MRSWGVCPKACFTHSATGKMVQANKSTDAIFETRVRVISLKAQTSLFRSPLPENAKAIGDHSLLQVESPANPVIGDHQVVGAFYEPGSISVELSECGPQVRRTGVVHVVRSVCGGHSAVARWPIIPRNAL